MYIYAQIFYWGTEAFRFERNPLNQTSDAVQLQETLIESAAIRVANFCIRIGRARLFANMFKNILKLESAKIMVF